MLLILSLILISFVFILSFTIHLFTLRALRKQQQYIEFMVGWVDDGYPLHVYAFGNVKRAAAKPAITDLPAIDPKKTN